MKKYRLTIFLGSTMLTHDSDTMYGVINALHDLASKLPDYGEGMADYETIDSYMEQLVQLKHGVTTAIVRSSPFLRIEYFAQA